MEAEECRHPLEQEIIAGEQEAIPMNSAIRGPQEILTNTNVYS